MDYYTQLVGDAVSPPTIKGDASFAGMALIDADPYSSTGQNWFTNQNNFFRQVRNFVIDTTGMPLSTGTGIHWQVAQATSLQNIVFNMRTDGGSANNHQVSCIFLFIVLSSDGIGMGKSRINSPSFNPTILLRDLTRYRASSWTTVREAC
jgi:hypothetical protein